MSKKMLTLMSNDKQQFTIEEEVAVRSIAIKNMVDDDCASSIIPLQNVDSKTLTLIIEYLNQNASQSDTDLKKFFLDREIATLFDLLLAANYLEIRDLLDILSQTISDLIKDKSVEEVREIFNIKNDFTPEEEEAVRAENAWAFEE